MRPRLSARLARLEAARVAKQQAVAGWGDVGLACLLEGTPPIDDSPEAEAELRAMLADPGTDPGVKSMLKMLFEYVPPPVECPARLEDVASEADEAMAAREVENAAFVEKLTAELEVRRAEEPPRQGMATIPREQFFPDAELAQMPDPGPLTPTIRIQNWRRS